MNKLHQLRVEWTKAKKNGDTAMMRIIEARARMLKPDKFWDDVKLILDT